MRLGSPAEGDIGEAGSTYAATGTAPTPTGRARTQPWMRAATVNRYTGPPATLGSTAAAGARFIVWCRDCRHQIEPDPVAMVEHYGAELSVPDWRRRLVCGQCGSRKIDFVVTGAKR